MKIEGIYVITDERLYPGRSHEEIAEAALTGGVRVIQLRDKKSSDERLIQAGREIRRMTNHMGGLLIINDRLEVALACDADGIHVGQEDLPAEEIRPVLGDTILGVSISNQEEAVRASNAGADYIGYGPIYSTSTKQDAGAAVGIGKIREIRAACGLPLVAIGGINAGNITDIIRAGADSAAVISAIVCEDDMVAATRALVKLWRSCHDKAHG